MPLPRARSRSFATGDQWLRRVPRQHLARRAAWSSWRSWTSRRVRTTAPLSPRPAGGLAFDRTAACTTACPEGPRRAAALGGRVAGRRGRSASICSSAAPPPVSATSIRPAIRRRSSARAARSRGRPDDRLFIAETAARRILVSTSGATGCCAVSRARAAARSGRARIVPFCALLSSPGTSGAPAQLIRSTRSGPRSCRATAGRSRIPRASRCLPVVSVFVARPRAHGRRRASCRAATTGRRCRGATDLEFRPDAVLVVARRPRRGFPALPPRLGLDRADPPLKARGYDGLGIVRTPDGRIGFWTSHGFRHAVPARVRYDRPAASPPSGSTAASSRRCGAALFLDACIPQDTDIACTAWPPTSRPTTKTRCLARCRPT